MSNNNVFYKKGLCGLQNLGNTCFMNSICQCINSNKDLAKYIISDAWKNDLNEDNIDNNLVNQWVLLSKGLYNENCVITPTSFFKCVRIIALQKGFTQFIGFGQNDSQEFLQFFLETLHNGLSKEVIMDISGEVKTELDKKTVNALKKWAEFFKNDYSIIVDLFYGQLHSSITTLNDEKFNSITYDPFSNLCLEIPEKETVDIYDCLNSFTISDNVNFRQNNDDTFIYKKKIDLWSTPKYLIIFFKRFKKINENESKKINTKIDFPINLNLNKYCVGMK